jgi:putative selenium metabolism hydrolase
MNWDKLTADCLNFAQRLIQTPSMSYEEEAIANLVAEEMRQLAFDEVWLDEVGNACGRIFGQDRTLSALVLNTHLDHVDPGDLTLWPVPPYSGEIAGGRLLGRGACDIKGPMAVQVYSMAALLRNGERPLRDVVFTGVVQEEIGGAGAIHWVENLDYPVALVVIGEPSSNKLALGHRGGRWLWAAFHGRSVHASVPERGDNPNYQLATFLGRLQTAAAELPEHPLLGKTTIAPTVIEVDTTSYNVTPAWTRVLLDCRTSVESTRSLANFFRQVGEGLNFTLREGYGEALLRETDEIITGFYTPPEEEVVVKAKALIEAGAGHEIPFSNYRFATDGRHFVPYNLPMIGYGPGDEFVAHTVKENIAIAEIAESLHGYVHLLRRF